MKKILILMSMMLISYFVKAEHISATSIPSVETGSTGAIDLHVYGGFAPYTFSWTGPDGFTATTEDITGLAPGLYTVLVTDIYCGTVSMDVLVGSYEEEENNDPDPSGINDELLQAEISVFPNPTLDHLNIHSEYGFTNGMVYLMDLQGRIVLKDQMIGTDKSMDVSGLPSGVYLLRIGEQEVFFQQKWVKE